MNRSIVTMADDATSDGLDGQWAEILRTGTFDGQTYTPADLDGIVSDYQKRQDADQAPVGLGTPAERNPQVVGKIGALKRVGSSLQAKFTGIDPRVEGLYQRGVFPKKSVQVKHSLDGMSLQRVGLIHPTYYAGSVRENETPSLDQMVKENMGNKDHTFANGRGFVQFEQPLTEASPSAVAAIAALKANGYWMARFDRMGFPAVFSELDHTPLLGKTVAFLKLLMDKGDPTSALLSERAQYYARSHGLTFGEALTQVQGGPDGVTGTPHSVEEVAQLSRGGNWGTQVSQQQRLIEKANSDQAVAANALNPDLARLAWARANASGMPFKQALAEVAGEHPELAVKHLAAWNVA